MGNVGLSDFRIYNAFGRNRVWAAKTQGSQLLLEMFALSCVSNTILTKKIQKDRVAVLMLTAASSDLSVYANGNISQEQDPRGD